MIGQLSAIGAALLPLMAGSVQAQQLYTRPCPLFDANYPAPTNLAKSPYVASAINSTRGELSKAINLTSVYGQYESNMTAFSLQVYSIHDDTPLFTYDYTPQPLASQRTVGVEAVNSDTVYRVGSVSKLWTVYIYLVAAGDQSWYQPITDFIPELATIAQQDGDIVEDASRVDWSSITIGALASQLAGLGRDAAYSEELVEVLGQFGIPNPGGNSHSTCGDPTKAMLPCNRTGFFEDFPNQHPIFASFHSPIYSNAAFQILSYALENITGMAMSDAFQKFLVEPLNLTSTYYTVPPSNVTASGMIPFNASISWWDADMLDETVTGGYYSSINDMRTIATAMLRSTQLSAAQTRRWMKPHTFLSDAKAAVGAPWEIMRAPGYPVSWMYTKAGDLGLYASSFVILPDYDVGFNVISAGNDPVNAARIISDLLSESWLPAIQAAAKAEAIAAYAGTYTDQSTNSTIVLSTKVGEPGLVLTEWTFGGADLTGLLAQFVGVDTSVQNLTTHLYSTRLSTKTANGTQTAWRAVYEGTPQPLDPGPFSQNCATWESVDSVIYGGVGFDEFLFTVDDTTGNAISIQSRALSLTLTKTASKCSSKRRV